MTELIDSHCHLQFESLKGDLGRVVADAESEGVGRMICVGTSLQDSEEATDFAARLGNVWASVGAHPHDGADYLHQADSDQRLAGLLTRPKVVAVGEIGLDYYRPISSKQDQQAVLRRQIEVGQNTSLPFIFHVRDAWEDFWKIFDSYQGITGVVHSFTAHLPELEQILSRGLYVSLNGIMTFTKDGKQLVAAKAAPKDRLLLETDAPFLTPAPFRGKPCEPKHVRVTAEFLAELRGETLDELAAATTKNSERLFGLSTTA